MAGQVAALDAQRTVIALRVAQVQPFGQVVGVGGVDTAAQEQAHASHEAADGGLVPGFGVGGIAFGQRELVGTIQQRQKIGLGGPDGSA